MRYHSSRLVPETMVVVDSYGSEWRRGPDYQDTNASAPGWMQLQSGVRLMSFTDVVNLRGFIGERGERFLVGLGEWTSRA